jgi:hypothetical protein
MMWAGCSTHESGTPRSALGSSGNEANGGELGQHPYAFASVPFETST